MLPATNDRLETHVVVEDPERAIHFQEWWVRYRAEIPAKRFVFVGADSAQPATGVLDALAHADVVLIAPSNPVVSIAPILAVAEAARRAGSQPRPRSSAPPRSSAALRCAAWPTSAWPRWMCR